MISDIPPTTFLKPRFFADEMVQQALAEQVGALRQTIIVFEAGKYPLSLFGITCLARRQTSAKDHGQVKL